MNNQGIRIFPGESPRTTACRDANFRIRFSTRIRDMLLSHIFNTICVSFNFAILFFCGLRSGSHSAGYAMPLVFLVLTSLCFFVIVLALAFFPFLSGCPVFPLGYIMCHAEPKTGFAADRFLYDNQPLNRLNSRINECPLNRACRWFWQLWR